VRLERAGFGISTAVDPDGDPAMFSTTAQTPDPKIAKTLAAQPGAATAG
jgi:hypothetical protein